MRQRSQVQILVGSYEPGGNRSNTQRARDPGRLIKKMEKREIVKESARDLISLGSIPFFILVLIRVMMLNKPTYFWQFVISGLIFLVIWFFSKINLYAGLALIIVVFTNLYYQDIKYEIFSILAYVLLLGSLIYLETNKKQIFLGILIGGVSSLITYFII